ncbi:hypothetical protein D3C81_1738010 [compost metagenome]
MAPIDSAASIMPGFTSSREFSTSRPIYGAMYRMSGTIAAFVPMEVWTIIRVNGIIATSKMIKGRERMMLITGLSKAYSSLFSRTPPGRVTTSNMPIGIPINVPTNKDIPTI